MWKHAGRHMGVAREGMEFIEGKGKELQKAMAGQVETGSRVRVFLFSGVF
jgi:hypothetical protein